MDNVRIQGSTMDTRRKMYVLILVIMDNVRIHFNESGFLTIKPNVLILVIVDNVGIQF